VSKLSSEVSVCGGYLGKTVLGRGHGQCKSPKLGASLECGRRKETEVLAVKKRRAEVNREPHGPSRPVKKDFGFCSE